MRRERTTCCPAAAGVHPAPGRRRKAGLRNQGRQAAAQASRPGGGRVPARVYLGDDPYCCEAVLEAGGSFLFTCKPKSHAALYEYIQEVEVDSLRTVNGRGRKKVHCFYRWMSGVPIRDGEDALKVN